MADFRPFRGLRYRPDVGDISSLLAPPYDVIDASEQAALHERSPHNIVRLEVAEERASDGPEENRYTRAAAALRSWRESGALAKEGKPAFYVYAQEFEHGGRRHRRTAVFGALRLEPWDAGVVRPHEETMRAPKEDRIQLLRHLRTQVSPVFGTVRAGLQTNDLPTGSPLFVADTPDGQRHELAMISEPSAIEAISSGLQDQPVYILDGHHRYETALAYREERQAQAGASWTGEEPENFVLMAITTADDAGLLLLPIHRLVRPTRVPADVVARLERFFAVDDTSPKSYDGTALLRLLARVSASGTSGTAFGALGLEEGRLHLLTLRDSAAVQSLMPQRSRTWQTLDVSVLEYAVLRETLGIESDTGAVAYTEDAAHALREVEAGRWPLAFLLNPTRLEQMLAVADAGERMPAKSTFFYPKLATGLVLYPFE